MTVCKLVCQRSYLCCYIVVDRPFIKDDGYLLLLDVRDLGAFQLNHIITATHFSWLGSTMFDNEQYFVNARAVGCRLGMRSGLDTEPLLHLARYTFVVIYDSHGLSSGG